MKQIHWWTDESEDLIDYLEIRLRQYEIHAEAMTAKSRDREGVDALIQRLKARLEGLRADASRNMRKAYARG